MRVWRGNIFEHKKWGGGGGKCGSEVGIISRGRSTFCLLPDFLAENICEADFFSSFCVFKVFYNLIIEMHPKA